MKSVPLQARDENRNPVGRKFPGATLLTKIEGPMGAVEKRWHLIRARHYLLKAINDDSIMSQDTYTAGQSYEKAGRPLSAACCYFTIASSRGYFMAKGIPVAPKAHELLSSALNREVSDVEANDFFRNFIQDNPSSMILAIAKMEALSPSTLRLLVDKSIGHFGKPLSELLA